jgi:hypothetical protein
MSLKQERHRRVAIPWIFRTQSASCQCPEGKRCIDSAGVSWPGYRDLGPGKAFPDPLTMGREPNWGDFLYTTETG